MIVGTLAVLVTLRQLTPVPPPERPLADPSDVRLLRGRPGRGRRQLGDLPVVPAAFLFVFAATGIGNGSTYRMIPLILQRQAEQTTTARAPEQAGTWRGRPRSPRRSIGIAGAVGALGGFLIPMTFGSPWVTDPVEAVKTAFVVFTGFYVVCLATTWFFYTRASPWPGGHPRSPPPTSDLLAPDPAAHPSDRSGDTVTDTHCPYCALQCGMRLTRASCARRSRSGAEFPVNRGALCHKGWTRGRAAAATASGSPPRWCGTGRRASCAPVVVGRGARPGRRPAGRAARAHGRDAVAVFGGGGLTNEKAYQLGKFARVALGTSQIDYNGRFCMSSAAAAGIRAFGLDRGLPFPLADLEQADVRRPRRLQPGRDDAAGRAPPRRAPRRAAARSWSSTRGARRPPDRADVFAAAGARAPTSRWRSALLHLLVADGAGRRGVRRRPHHRLGRGPRVGRRPGGPSGSSGSPACRPTSCGALADAAGRQAEQGRWCSPPAAPSSTAQGTDTVLAWINLALALGHAGHAGRRLRLPHRPGQRPGRARARPEGRPAARLPDDRRPGRPRARRRRLGRRPGLAARARGARRTSCSTRSAAAAARRRCWSSAPTSSSPRPAPPTSTERLESLDLLVVADIVLSETAALADVVLPVTQWAEEAGTMTNLEGRVILRAAGAQPARRACARDLDVIAGLAVAARARRASFATDPEDGLRRARPGVGGRQGRLRRHHLRPDPRRARRVLALPRRRTTPARRGCSSTPSRTPDGRARFVAVEHRGARRGAGRRLPGAPHHRPGARAVPVRRPDPPGPRPARHRALRRAAPDARRTARRRATASRSPWPPGAAR